MNNLISALHCESSSKFYYISLKNVQNEGQEDTVRLREKTKDNIAL